jgi:hypothetical protein
VEKLMNLTLVPFGHEAQWLPKSKSLSTLKTASRHEQPRPQSKNIPYQLAPLLFGVKIVQLSTEADSMYRLVFSNQSPEEGFEVDELVNRSALGKQRAEKALKELQRLKFIRVEDGVAYKIQQNQG